MDRLEVVQARLQSIQQLLDVVGAMRAMAAVRLQQAMAALPGAQAYAATMGEAMADALLLADAPPRPPSGPSAVLVFTAEHGFVGAFNEALIEQARSLAPARLFVVGSRGALVATEAGVPMDWALPMTGRVDGAAGLARRLAERLYPLYLSGAIGRLDMVRGRVGAGVGGRWHADSVTLLPLDPRRFPPVRRRSFPPLHTLPAEQLLADISGQFLLADLACAATEALAAENAARLAATSGAHDNIQRRQEQLRLAEQVLRQDAITTELLDVITGADMILSQLAAERP